ncbi:hypothetical protein CHS0354_034620 [Potamilus streckersoni]|uniref:Death domain-containing protein n=1 Tax=Potamilus streckersoni TaxID=2493646 RepID=A0AAE0W1W0_9BIVA|nr:hypothetical protein CHS0354_034620 [Potamilus streckersoni]
MLGLIHVIKQDAIRYSRNRMHYNARFTAELLHSIAEAVGVNWRKLARRLSIPDEKRENIDTNSRFTSCDEKCYQMLSCWCNASKHATKELLASKLIACDLHLTAVKYLGDYVQDNHNTV